MAVTGLRLGEPKIPKKRKIERRMSLQKADFFVYCK